VSGVIGVIGVVGVIGTVGGRVVGDGGGIVV